MLNLLSKFKKKETKRNISDLVDELSQVKNLKDSVWRHRKGGVYRIICVAFREATMQTEVVYEDVAHPVTYIRPRDEFMDGRFERVDDV